GQFSDSIGAFGGDYFIANTHVLFDAAFHVVDRSPDEKPEFLCLRDRSVTAPRTGALDVAKEVHMSDVSTNLSTNNDALATSVWTRLFVAKSHCRAYRCCASCRQ